MTTAPILRAEDIFFSLLETPPADRGAALDAACGADEALKAEVRSLLANHRETREFMETGRLREQAGIEDDAPLPPGAQVGEFTVVGVLGVGGMGVVYMARQEKPRRTVALKLIKRSAGRGLVKRFEHEAEVLARLQHPGIAQIYQAGSAPVAGGQESPYIVMEMIEGRTLTRHAEAFSLSREQRLDLIARVCDAVHHAHQRGVVHRDLKPGNILVDEHGQPKILDFGIARAAGAEMNVTTMSTGVGQIVGTLQYMSPEQVRGDPEGVDARSDVYALGAILFELLTARLPHELSDKSLPEAARILCEETAPRLGLYDRSLRGDLEIIVAKALEKERPRRYATAAELGEDLRRCLDGRPIVARDDSALYLLRKRLRRYRGTLVVAAVSVAALAGLAAYALVQSARNERLAVSEAKAKTEALDSLKAAKAARELADRTSDRLAKELAAANLERGRLSGRAGNLTVAEDLIWPVFLADPTSREAHWALWDVYSRQPCLANFKAHEGPVWGAVLAGEGGAERLYTAGADGAIKDWNLASLSLARTFTDRPGTVNDLVLSPDGTRLASAHSDGSVTVWDLESGSAAVVIAAAHPGGARSVSFSPTGAMLVSGGSDRALRIWDARTGARLRETVIHEQPVARVRWGPAGDVIAASAGEGPSPLRLWSMSDGTVTNLVGHTEPLTSMAFTADGRTLATAGHDREVRFWDMGRPGSPQTMAVPTGIARTLAFTRDGVTLLAGGWWSTDLWDVRTHQLRRSLSLPETAYSNAIAPDGSVVASGFGDGWVRVWGTGPRGASTRLPGHQGPTRIAISPDGRLAATGDETGAVRLWETAGARALARISGTGSAITSLRFSPDGATLLAASADDSARLLDLRTGREMARFPVVSRAVTSAAAFSRDGRLLATAGPDSRVVVRTLPGLETVATLDGRPELASVSGLAFTPDDAMLVLSGDLLRMALRRLDGAPAPTIPESTPGWRVSFSADGRRAACLGGGSHASLLDTATWQPIRELGPETGIATAVAFHPTDPGIVCTTTADGAVRLWDPDSGRELIRLEGLRAWEGLNLSFSADGRIAVTSGAAGAAEIWDLSYFDRHIAGNAEFQLIRQTPSMTTPPRSAEVRAWAGAVLGPRAAGPATGIAPGAIAAWGRGTLAE